MNATTQTDTLMVDVKEVARLLTVSIRTVERMVGAGQFPQPVRLNKRNVRWPRATVEAWVASHTPPVDGLSPALVSLRINSEA